MDIGITSETDQVPTELGLEFTYAVLLIWFACAAKVINPKTAVRAPSQNYELMYIICTDVLQGRRTPPRFWTSYGVG
jgi:hypothetical protein